MIGHGRRWGHSALASAAGAHILPRQRRRVRSLPVDRAERGNQLGVSAPWGESGLGPVARIGRASPSAHPVGRQPIRGPVPARTCTPVRRGLPGPAGDRHDPRGAQRPVRPFRYALRSSAALAAGVLLLPPPAGAIAATPHGSAEPASPSAAAPPASPPSVAAAAVGRPLVASVTCRMGCLGLATAAPGSGRRSGRPAPEPDGRERGQPSRARSVVPGAALPDAQLVRCASCGS
jgi:hypothetical protein